MQAARLAPIKNMENIVPASANHSKIKRKGQL
jgi:hypothetical protein